MLFTGVHLQCNRFAVGQTQCGFKAFGQSLLHIHPHLDAVNHHINVVLFGFFEFG